MGESGTSERWGSTEGESGCLGWGDGDAWASGKALLPVGGLEGGLRELGGRALGGQGFEEPGFPRISGI